MSFAAKLSPNASHAGVYWLIILGIVGLLLLIGLWLKFGRIPRRRRLHRRVLRVLSDGKWSDARQLLEQLKKIQGRSKYWDTQVRAVEADCLRAAAAQDLGEKKFEESLQHLLHAARLLNENEGNARDHVVASMLGEVRRLSATPASKVSDLLQLIERVFTIQSPCPEASFWLGLCKVREGLPDAALERLRTSQEGVGKSCFDPLLYQGALLLKMGKTQDALRVLAEANRMEPGNAFVGWQLGTALVIGSGDTNFAVRALQKALGIRGLPRWVRSPEKAWVEGFPDPAKSFVSRLAAQHRFMCPVFGGDVGGMVWQGMLTLSQAQYRLGNFQETANICEGLLKDAPPSVPVLRGLGLSLAKLGRHDEAFKHLRAAFEMEEPKDYLTAGYLALCGACGKPNKAEDKPNNVAWAIKLVGKFELLGNAEWASLLNSIFAEARKCNLAVSLEDQMRCCLALASVEAVDAEAAGAYDQLAFTSPESVRQDFAWLYGRAAQQHDFKGRRDLELLGLNFRQRSAAQDFFAKRSWEFEEVEVAYLSRWAAVNPATFPPEMGNGYADHARGLLLERSRLQEQAGDPDEAQASADLLLRLLPASPEAHDRLAQLSYQRNDVVQAIQLLAQWHRHHPTDERPLVRLAVLHQAQGNRGGCIRAMETALGLTQGPRRASVAFLAARLVLAGAMNQENASAIDEASGNAALHFLGECLHQQPDHADALACLAATRWHMGDFASLAKQAPAMCLNQVEDGRFHYLAAVAHLAAEDAATALEAAQRAAVDPNLSIESQHLIGLAQLRLGFTEAAVQALQTVGQAESGSTQQARAILGNIGFQNAIYTDAAHWWQMLDIEKRKNWQLDEPYKGTVYLAAIQAQKAGWFEQAAEQYRLAGKLGYRDRQLGSLLSLALFKAGQRALQSADPTEANGAAKTSAETAANFLTSALQVGLKDPAGTYLLAIANKRRGLINEAREALRKIKPPDADVWLQMGLLSLKERLYPVAETEFAQGWELDSKSFALAANLMLTRLSLGKTDAALELAPAVVSMAPNPEDWFLFSMLHAILRNIGTHGAGDSVLVSMSTDDEQRLVKTIRGLGHLETIGVLLKTLRAARSDSTLVREAYFESVLMAARQAIDRCDWGAAERALRPLIDQRDLSAGTLAAFFNLLGASECLTQDITGGAEHFTLALRLVGADMAIHQNLALAYEWQRDLTRAEPHWNRYFDLLDRRSSTHPEQHDYCVKLAFEGLLRLANLYVEKERWPNAIACLESARQLNPVNVEALDRLFHLYQQQKKPDRARQILRQLQELQPGEPQFELYELDLIEINEIEDMEKWLGEVTKILQRHPGETRVEERAATMVTNAVAFMTRISDQLTDQLNKVMKQVRGLENYQINWTAVHDVMRNLKREFTKLRRLAGKCQTMGTLPEHRRVLHDLADHLDRKIDYCRRWQGD